MAAILLIYGAGSMGSRIAARACGFGMDVTLAGRPSSGLAVLARSLGVPWRSAILENPVGLDVMLAGVHIVVNAAGPFAHTAPALMRACVRNGCQYLDLSNEASTFLDACSLDRAAREAGISIVPGAGFGTAASEALASHVVKGLGHVDVLSIVRTSGRGPRTPGVHRTMMELLARPGAAVRNGHWASGDAQIATFNLPEGRVTAIPVALGDAFAAARSTGVRNVTAYSGTRMNSTLARIAVPIARHLARVGLQRPRIPGKDAGPPASEETLIWIQAAGGRDRTAAGYLQAGGGGQLAAEIALEGIVQLQSRGTPGFLTAGELVGPGYVPNLSGVRIVTL